jgi:hypothetical protein
MMDYELANYLLSTLPPDEREQTVATLHRANAAEFRRMRETVVRGGLLDEAEPVAPEASETSSSSR